MRLAEETEQGISEQVNRGGGDDQGEDGAVEENSRGSLVEDGREKIVGSCGDENADEREEVRGCDDSALLFSARSMLLDRLPGAAI